MVLKLQSATRFGDPKKIAQAVGELFASASLNSQIPHLEGESIFGSTKRKLDLPPGNENDSYQHNYMNYTLPKIRQKMTIGQSRIRTSLSETTGVPSLNIAYAVSGLPIHKSACSNPMA